MIKIATFTSSGGGGSSTFPAGITSGVPADATVNATIDGLDSRSFNMVYNGTTWDLLREANAANVTSGTGLLGAGCMGFDSANWQRLNTMGAFSDATSSASIGRVLAIGGMVFNGATWDRWRGSTDSITLTGALRVIPVSFNYSHQFGPATVTPKASSGVLHTVTVNSAVAAGTLTIFDNTTGTGTIIASVSIATFQGTLIFDAVFSTGLTYVVVGATADVTLTWR